MSSDFEAIVKSCPEARLAIRTDGPPTYQGENPHRIIIDGNPSAFRMLAQTLNMMAEAVEKQGCGWYFVVSEEVIPQLQLDEGHLLALVCDPESGR